MPKGIGDGTRDGAAQAHVGQVDVRDRSIDTAAALHARGAVVVRILPAAARIESVPAALAPSRAGRSIKQGDPSVALGGAQIHARPGTGVARTRGSRVHEQDRERECKRQCRHQCASRATDGSQVPRVDPQNGGVVEVLEAAWTMQARWR